MVAACSSTPVPDIGAVLNQGSAPRRGQGGPEHEGGPTRKIPPRLERVTPTPRVPGSNPRIVLLLLWLWLWL